MKYVVKLNGGEGYSPDGQPTTFLDFTSTSHAFMDLLLALTEGESYTQTILSREGEALSMMVQHHGGVDTIDLEVLQ